MRLTQTTSFDGLSHRMVEFEHGEYVRYIDYHEAIKSLKEVLSLAREWGANPEYYTQADSNIIGFAEDVIAKAEGK